MDEFFRHLALPVCLNVPSHKRESRYKLSTQFIEICKRSPIYIHNQAYYGQLW